MKTNTDCTIIYSNGDGTYTGTYIPAVMWQDVSGIETKKYGTENADTAAVYIPDITVAVSKGDYIIKGAVTNYTTAMETALTITNLSVKDYSTNGTLDHIKVGAK